MEVKFDKRGAINYHVANCLKNIGYSFVAAFVIDLAMVWMFQFPTFWYLFVIALIWNIAGFLYEYRIVTTMSYEIDKSGKLLVQKYRVIGKATKQARLQIVNSVSIEQSWFDKFFDLFSVRVDYGFGDEGYQFSYYYLDEKTVEALIKKIKARGRLVKMV